MMFLIKFCGKRPKRTLDSVESAKYDEKKNSTCTYSFMTFLLSWIGIFPFRGSGFSADPDPDAEKKSSIRILNKTRIRNTEHFTKLLLFRVYLIPC